MHRVRLVMVGGFLGAGKTTALLALSKGYHDGGLRVGLITNDQAADLVDTGLARVRGFRVEEVAGACFCCKFDELARAADRIRTEESPDVLLAEPVGSCTDLAATVVAPLRGLHGDRYSVAPYSVLVDPARARQMILETGCGGFSSKVAYIFLKQLEEAEIICLNKVDLLSPAERDELLGALSRQFPGARAIAISALTGEGLREWRSLLDRAEAAPRIAEVDYDLYAEGEAELGWLNLTMQVDGAQGFRPEAVVLDLLERMRILLLERGAEVAHLKAMLETPAGAAVANCVSTSAPVRVGGSPVSSARTGKLVLNARAHLDPDLLRVVLDKAARETFSAHGASGRIERSAQFRPGRPVPTHRFRAASPARGQGRDIAPRRS